MRESVRLSKRFNENPEVFESAVLVLSELR